MIIKKITMILLVFLFSVTNIQAQNEKRDVISIAVAHSSFDRNMLGNTFEVAYQHFLDDSFSFESNMKYAQGGTDDVSEYTRQYQFNINAMYAPFTHSGIVVFRLGAGLGALYSQNKYWTIENRGVRQYDETSGFSAGFNINTSLSVLLFKNVIAGTKIEYQSYFNGFDSNASIFIVLGYTF